MENINRFDIAEVTISYKLGRYFAPSDKICGANCAFEIAQDVCKDFIEYHEQFFIILLNQSNKVLGVSQISAGGISSTLVDLRLVFQRVLKANAVSFIAFHNHPSGNLQPSEADKQLTKKLKTAAETLDIKLLDHLIITTHSYFSFADEGLL